MPVQIEQLDVLPRPRESDSGQSHNHQQSTQQQGRQAGEHAMYQLDGEVERAIALMRSRELRLRAT